MFSFARAKRIVRPAVLLLGLSMALPVVTGCSREAGSDLAVARMSESQVQSTGYLPLNEDKPGTPVDPRRYLVKGKFTIVEYYSPYSAQSITFGQGLLKLSQNRPDIAVRTINVNRPGVQGVDFQSPIMQELQLSAVPYFQIFDPAGGLRAHARPAYEQVAQWVQ